MPCFLWAARESDEIGAHDPRPHGVFRAVSSWGRYVPYLLTQGVNSAKLLIAKIQGAMWFFKGNTTLSCCQWDFFSDLYYFSLDWWSFLKFYNVFDANITLSKSWFSFKGKMCLGYFVNPLFKYDYMILYISWSINGVFLCVVLWEIVDFVYSKYHGHTCLSISYNMGHFMMNTQ